MTPAEATRRRVRIIPANLILASSTGLRADARHARALSAIITSGLRRPAERQMMGGRCAVWR